MHLHLGERTYKATKDRYEHYQEQMRWNNHPSHFVPLVDGLYNLLAGTVRPIAAVTMLTRKLPHTCKALNATIRDDMYPERR